jgi:hypothetical protein
VIRNIVLGRLRVAADADAADRDRQQADDGFAGILALHLPGLLDNRAGWDCHLREGGWDFAITNDWADAESYRRYDADPDHLRYRTMIADVCQQLARVQFEIADEG